MSDKEQVILKVAGQDFTGWETVRVTRTLNALCADFSLTLYDDNPGRTDRSVVTDDAPCELWLGEELLITGYIGEISQDLTEKHHSITVTGRDRTGDLIDCSAEHASGTWKKAKLESIARELVKPFGIEVRVEADTGAAFAGFALEHGESVFDALTRLCGMRGLMIGTNPKSELIIFSPTAERSKILAFVLGDNIKTIRFRSTSTQRFSTITVKGQHSGGDHVSAKDAARPKGTAKDAGVKRYRPLIVISDEQSTAAGLETRALFEVASRLGNAQEASVNLMGWRDADRKLYVPNVIVPVVADYVGLNRDMMVAEVTLELGSATMASFRLVAPEAYTTEAIIEAKLKKAKKKKGGMDWAGALGSG